MIASLAAALVLAGAAPAAPLAPPPLQAEIQTLAAPAGGTPGVAIVHVETGERVSVNGAGRFPMASVYKVPIALAVLHQVDAGRVALDSTLEVTPADLRIGASPIAARHPEGGRFTVRELLEAMLIPSDNTASDVLLRLAGGPQAVNARLRELGVGGVRVDRSEAQQSFDYHGVAKPPPPAEWSVARFLHEFEAVSAFRRSAAAKVYLDDPRDTATPDGMADLLVRVQKGEALQPETTAFLLDAMARSTTGPRRLKGRLPPGTAVAHKTGTTGAWNGIRAGVNDVGLITLPDSTHLAIAVFVKGSNRGERAAERAIARIARAAYDHWCGRTGAPGASPR